MDASPSVGRLPDRDRAGSSRRVLMAMTAHGRPAASLRPDDGPLADEIAVLAVPSDADDPDPVSAALGRHDGFTVETATTPAAVASHLGPVDCVVADGSRSADALDDLLATVRDRDPHLPFVLLAEDPSTATIGSLLDVPWTDCFRREPVAARGALLARRIRSLVARRRVTALARRALTAVEQCTDAKAIVAPDDTVEFANPLFARRFGATPAELVGRDWRDLYPDAEVERLESDAFPSLADGWRWMGDCEARRDDGTTFRTQIRIDALDDGLLFTIADRRAETE